MKTDRWKRSRERKAAAAQHARPSPSDRTKRPFDYGYLSCPLDTPSNLRSGLMSSSGVPVRQSSPRTKSLFASRPSNLTTDEPRVDAAVAERLIRARKMAGYATAGAAIAYRRWKLADYLAQEAGRRAITADDALRYSAGYRVSARWIMIGE
jgi:hypothetical protein